MEEKTNISILESQIRECYGRIVWTHKTHEKCADILNSRDGHIKLLQIILSALVTSGITASLFSQSKEIIGSVTAIISLFLLILNTYMRKYDLGGASTKTRRCGSFIMEYKRKLFISAYRYKVCGY